VETNFLACLLHTALQKISIGQANKIFLSLTGVYNNWPFQTQWLLHASPGLTLNKAGMFAKPLLPWESDMYYKFWVCIYNLRYPACKEHVPYCHLLPAWLYYIVPHFLMEGTFLGGGGKFLNIKYVLWFFYNFRLQDVLFQEKLN